ncbi:MAG: hypothetical protein AAF358_08785 [Pseudomonadota bacterium]
MSTMIQIRHVPDSIHRTLKARAALAGTSLSEYLLHELEAIASRPTQEELLESLAELEPVSTKTSLARAVRQERDRR